MLVLSLLLSAAAGVNAISGGEVNAVRISDEAFFCANYCTYRGVFFSQRGYRCPQDQLVIIKNKNGEYPGGEPFDCVGAPQPSFLTEHQRTNEGEPDQCQIHKTSRNPNLICVSNKISSDGKKIDQLVQWSDIEKELRAATPTNQAAQGAPKKSQEECADIGGQTFRQCRGSGGDFATCDALGREAIRKCADGQ